MMKINVYSEKSGNFGANSEKKPIEKMPFVFALRRGNFAYRHKVFCV